MSSISLELAAIVNQHQAAPQTPQQELLQLMEACRHGWPLDHRTRTVDAARALSTEQINHFIQTFFAPEAVVQLRLLPAPRLAPTDF